MNLTFREAERGDVMTIVALLRQDSLGATRESDEADAYLAAFEAMQAQAGKFLFVGE